MFYGILSSLSALKIPRIVLEQKNILRGNAYPIMPECIFFFSIYKKKPILDSI